jgi:hypothetical protein
MVRKELEDTWRRNSTRGVAAQDQERTIDQPQRSVCSWMTEQCRSQWKDAEDGWTKEAQELQLQLNRRSKKHAPEGGQGRRKHKTNGQGGDYNDFKENCKC